VTRVGERIDHAPRDPGWRWRILVPFSIWGLHVSTGYVIVALYCHQQFFDYEILGAPATRVIMWAVTLLAIAFAVVALLRNLAHRRATAADANGRLWFTSNFGSLACGLLLLYLVWTLVPITIGELCW